MRRALVLGGYGLIGSACMRALAADGFKTTGLGRSQSAASACDPAARWLIRDIASIAVAEWRDLLSGFDVVVNASGALQDGARDDLTAIHVTAISNLVEGAKGLPVRVVHISAAGVSVEAPTPFFRTKARGDAILAASAVDHVILRPTLVLSREAYGGTALLRAFAALPLIMPRVLPDAQVQTVHVDDVAGAVVLAANGRLASGTVTDLTEPQAQDFATLVETFRNWLGFAPPRIRFAFPAVLLPAVSRTADLLGLLGWRSPLRTNAIVSLSAGITGNPNSWAELGLPPCRSLAESLAAMPATRQERLFARAYFALPLAILTLSLFWLLSGLITLVDPARAMDLLEHRGVSPALRFIAVIGGAFADIGLGLAIAWRPWVRPAALGMLLLSGLYLAGSVLVAADLWGDPLGPMVKVFPGMALAAMVWLLVEER